MLAISVTVPDAANPATPRKPTGDGRFNVPTCDQLLPSKVHFCRPSTSSAR